MTGRHRGPKQNLWADYRVPSLQWTSCLKRLHLVIRCDYVFIVECGIARFLFTMQVFEVRTSPSSPRLPLCQISFLLRPPLLS